MKIVKDYICMILDFFYEGIMFCDVIMLFGDLCGFCMVIDQLFYLFLEQWIDKVVGFEVCGFILGGVVVY